MTACSTCGFDLWTPLASKSGCTVGLYDDMRFPGRLLVRVDEHYEHLMDVPAETAHQFMDVVNDASRALTEAVNAARISMAVMGDADDLAHVYAHVVPRKRMDPPLAKSPWDDPRERGTMLAHDRDRIVAMLGDRLAHHGFVLS